MRRTHRCGAVTREQLGERVVLQGWVWHRRDMGGVIFIDLRDRAGFVQCVFNPDSDEALHALAHGWRPEYVVEIEGTVIERGANVNAALPNGDIEVAATGARLLATAETPPFVIEEEPRTSEEMRLRNRFLDLRRGPLQRALALRHRLALATRLVLDELGFLEIETPMLTRSTPEGARDYLVPSRVHPGHFYALPQSPQLFKQLLMISGYDRYFQIVRCFRDEDLRADRQPEFTQIDLEMSFVQPRDVQEVAEAVVRRLLAVAGHGSEVEFPRLTFREALDRFGTDRPDTRYAHELFDATELFADCEFRAFAQVAGQGGAIKGLVVPGGAEWSRSRLDKLAELAKTAGARGLVWIKRQEDGFHSPVAKFLGDDLLERLGERAAAGVGDLMLLAADEWEIAAVTMGTIRSSLAAEEGWIGEGMHFLWVTDFPLLERDDQAGRYVARHHPFTSPLEEDLDRLDTAPLQVRAQAYDLVLNGVELGGGSIRIHREDLQERVFSTMGIAPEEAQEKFGFLLKALRYGAPPHGGIALGFDRIVMLMAGAKSLRDVIAFPKTTTAQDAMTDAPGTASADQLAGLHIEVIGEPEEQVEE